MMFGKRNKNILIKKILYKDSIINERAKRIIYINKHSKTGTFDENLLTWE